MTGKVGGNTANFTHNWRKITSDPWVISESQGIHIPLKYIPFQGVEPRPIRFSINECGLMSEAVMSLADKGVIELSEEEPYQFISNIFMVPKPNGKVRIILDLSKFNEAVEKSHFKMDSIHTATSMILPGVFMCSIDLQDAYFTFPIVEEHRKYLKFRWEGKLWRFIGLPMGITCAPRIFTKLILPIYAHLRGEGVQCFPYLDDSFIFGFSEEECKNSTFNLANLLIDLGFKVHLDKSEMIPTQKLQFLGFFIDSVKMTVSLPDSKVDNVIDICDLALKSSVLSIRFVLHIIGTLNSYCVAVDYGANNFKQIESDQIKALKYNRGNFDALMQISEKAKVDLFWWTNNVSSSLAYIRTKNPDVSLYSDASNLGWGAFSGPEKIQGEWNQEELDLHINAKELLAILYGLQFLHSDKINITVHILTDNTTAVSHINRMGGVKSTECRKVAYKIWKWAECRKNWLYATHIPGIENEIADDLSRNFSSNVDWELNDDIFEDIVSHLGIPTVDLFASRHNTKLTRYCSWFPDSYCWKTDAFSFEWTDEVFYIFPPFRLAGKCWRKIMTDAAQAILVIPDWPNQHFYASVIKTAKEVRRFPTKHRNLSHPRVTTSNNNFSSVPLIACRY